MQSLEPKVLKLVNTFDRWKEEHELLHERLLELCRYMRWNPGNYEYHDWSAHHRLVREKFLPFMEAWQRHLHTERMTIYPLARSIPPERLVGIVDGPEQHCRFVARAYESYANAVAEGASPEEALSLLLEVLVLVADRFRVEEEKLLPAAEQLLVEIEYNGS